MLAALLVCGDGFAASLGSMARAFRENVPNPSGIGRTCLEAWPTILMGIVKKHRHEKRVIHVTRNLFQGLLQQALAV